MTLKLKALLFDMDGTVLDTEPVHKEAWEKAMKQNGMANGIFVLDECIGLNEPAMKELFYQKLGCSDFDRLYEEAKIFARAVKNNGIPVKKGFHELYGFLKKNNIKTAIVTSSNHDDAVRDLKRANIIDCFDTVVGFGDYEKGKPDPAPYRKAAEILGCKSNECLAVEDSALGLLSAVNAGIRCVYIKDTIDIDNEKKALAFKCIESFLEFEEIIKAFNILT